MQGGKVVIFCDSSVKSTLDWASGYRPTRNLIIFLRGESRWSAADDKGVSEWTASVFVGFENRSRS